MELRSHALLCSPFSRLLKVYGGGALRLRLLKNTSMSISVHVDTLMFD